MPTEHRPKLTYDAPIGSVDLAAHDDDGNPYEIRSCSHCLPWYAEVIIDDEGAVFEREWHASSAATRGRDTGCRNGTRSGASGRHGPAWERANAVD